MRHLGIGLAIAFLLVFFGPAITLAQSGIEVQDTAIENKFPEGILFKVQASSTSDIKKITVVYKIGMSYATQYGVAKFDPAQKVSAEFMLRTRTGGERSSTFIPPGTEITYQFRIEDAEGNTLETQPLVLLYMDSRFKWEPVTKELVTVYYHGPVKGRAETVLDVTYRTLKNMGELMGAEIKHPIRIVMYNNVREMLDALPFTSQTSQRGLVTQGQAYGEEGVLLLLGGDPNVKGVASHEVTHLMVYQAAEGMASFIPSWLNEGLAEYGNIEPSYTYEQALDKGLAEGRIFPIRSMTNRPGNPDDVILFYGQSRSIVRFLVNKYGPEKLRALLRFIKQGQSIDTALKEAYGFDRIGLDNEWRRSVGAPALPAAQQATPTPGAIPTLVPFGAEVPSETPTPTPSAQATATPTPSSAVPASPASGAGCRAAATQASIMPATWDFLFLPMMVMTGMGLAFLRRRGRRP